GARREERPQNPGERRRLGTGSKAEEMLEGLVLGVIFATIILFLVFFLVWRFRTFLTFFWHEKVLLSIVNFISGMSKEERILSWVKEHAVPGNPQSVLDAIDYYCYNNEWAMNVGDTKEQPYEMLLVPAPYSQSRAPAHVELMEHLGFELG
ncbi:catechol O-methyltransferase-like, partial [Gracilinanus agilis]|uniref:catechol O-methyltransferase-like n=1 Tax=Gracilinanus agilis TaxID=191870 RepID=UPI001CFCB174